MATDGEGGIELVAADFRAIEAVFALLEAAAHAHESMGEVRIVFRLEGGDTITVGYGVNAEPAVLAISNSGVPAASAALMEARN